MEKVGITDRHEILTLTVGDLERHPSKNWKLLPFGSRADLRRQSSLISS